VKTLIIYFNIKVREAAAEEFCKLLTMGPSFIQSDQALVAVVQSLENNEETFLLALKRNIKKDASTQETLRSIQLLALLCAAMEWVDRDDLYADFFELCRPFVMYDKRTDVRSQVIHYSQFHQFWSLLLHFDVKLLKFEIATFIVYLTRVSYAWLSSAWFVHNRMQQQVV
jgi:hypothetical protein